jgi:5-methylthioadenosine/S-adenosylhomocysteine deaminase
MSLNEHFDLLLKPGRVVTMDGDRRVLCDAVVGVRGSDIAYVGPADERFTADEVVEQADSILIPGMINAHTHVPMTLMRGLADDLALMDWLQNHIFPTEAQFVNEEFVYWGSRLAALELFQCGVTTFCDMFYHGDQVARAAQDAGIRAMIGADISQAYLQDLSPSERIERGIALHEKYMKMFQSYDLVTYALGPHSPYTASPEFLSTIRQEALDQNISIIMHIAETQHEKAMIEENFGIKIDSPIMHLQDMGFFEPHVVSIHTVHATDQDLKVLQKNNVGVVHCPQSNLKLGSGLARVPDMLEQGIAVGLGTDGAASNNDLVLWEEMSLAAMVHKGVHQDPTLVTAEQAFAMTTCEGAKVLGMQDQIGSIEVGKKADLAWVDTRSFHQIPAASNVYSQLVYSTKASDVFHVWVNGQCKMKDRQVLDQDQQEICAYAVQKRQTIDSFLAKRNA